MFYRSKNRQSESSQQSEVNIRWMGKSILRCAKMVLFIFIEMCTFVMKTTMTIVLVKNSTPLDQYKSWQKVSIEKLKKKLWRLGFKS